MTDPFFPASLEAEARLPGNRWMHAVSLGASLFWAVFWLWVFSHVPH